MNEVRGFRNHWWNRALTPVGYWTIFALTLAVGVVLRVVYCRLEPTICPDGPIYIELATRWIGSGSCPDHDYLPLYTYLMTLLMRCGLDGHAAGLWINVAAGTLFIPAAWWVILAATGHREMALAGALLAAFHPLAIDLAVNVQRDALYLLLAGAAIAAALTAVRKRPGYGNWALAAVFLAAGLFTRYETLELLVPALLYWFLAAWRGTLRRRQAVLGCVIFVLTLGLSCAALLAVLGAEKQMKRAYWSRIERLVEQRL